MCVCRSEEHIEVMKATVVLKSRDLHRLASEYNSVFLSQQSYSAALLAAGAAFNAAQGILTGQVLTPLHCTALPLHNAALHNTTTTLPLHNTTQHDN